jgi:hypothetical protein
VSNQDSKFITTFSIVIGILVAITILLLALARAVAGRTQVVDVYKDPMYLASLQHNTAPLRPGGRRRPGQFGHGDQGAGRCRCRGGAGGAEERP